MPDALSPKPTGSAWLAEPIIDRDPGDEDDLEFTDGRPFAARVCAKVDTYRHLASAARRSTDPS